MIKRADLHAHTRFSLWKHLKIIKPRDSYETPMDLYERCKQMGMDFVAITDHDTIDGALDLLSRRPDLEPEIIVGEEVETHFPDTGQWVHVNVFDLDEPTHREIVRLKANVYDLVAYLRQRRLLFVLNHPFQSYRLQKPASEFLDEILELFDHFEVGNATLPASHNKVVAELIDHAVALHARKIGLGGSDAHNLRNVGLYWTEAPVDAAAGKREWLAAVARGEARAVGRAKGVASLTADVYRIIGRYYLSLLDPEVRSQMRTENYLAAAALVPACAAGLPAFLNAGNRLRLEAVTQHLRRSLRSKRRSNRVGLTSRDLIEDRPE